MIQQTSWRCIEPDGTVRPWWSWCASNTSCWYTRYRSIHNSWPISYYTWIRCGSRNTTSSFSSLSSSLSYRRFGVSSRYIVWLPCTMQSPSTKYTLLPSRQRYRHPSGGGCVDTVIGSIRLSEGREGERERKGERENMRCGNSKNRRSWEKLRKERTAMKRIELNWIESNWIESIASRTNKNRTQHNTTQHVT